MRFSQAEKMEIIRLVQDSELSVKRTLEELDVPVHRSTVGTSVTRKTAMML
jgi:transposase-like protein